MEPIPESRQALDELGPYGVDEDLLEQLVVAGEQVRALVPDCVGLSLASLEHGLTFTLVASDREFAVLDAVQYLAGGPCVESVRAERVVACNQASLLDEGAWHLFAKATAAAGVASTLTLPILARARVVGSVNLYAASAEAFSGHHQAIARIFDAWAPGAVVNADLAFDTRRAAERAPHHLREQTQIEVAAGVIAALHDIDVDAARRELRDAALRAGVSEARFA
ncbi:MAG: GAF domain-containing protein, partial [Actinomycetota bacterium]|nr:GAF domain-containing protein [Actinomycetota bacterium]